MRKEMIKNKQKKKLVARKGFPPQKLRWKKKVTLPLFKQ